MLLIILFFKYGYENYLEIGTYDITHNFIHIQCKNKESIDPAPLNPDGITYLLSSDDAFDRIKSLNKKYDIIFIDGLHLEHQVDKDINNSLECLSHNGTIVLHDCNPPLQYNSDPDYNIAKIYANGEWNGTVYKSIIKFNKNNTCCCVIDTDWGCGIIRPILQSTPIKINYEPLVIEWAEFNENRIQLLNLIPLDVLYNL